MKFSSFMICCAASALVTAIGATSHAQTQTPPPAAGTPTNPAAPADSTTARLTSGDAAKGKTTFETRCTTCHTEEGTFAPTPETLGTFSPAHIHEALTTGPMVPNAVGLTEADFANIITYLTTQSKPATPAS